MQIAVRSATEHENVSAIEGLDEANIKLHNRSHRIRLIDHKSSYYSSKHEDWINSFQENKEILTQWAGWWTQPIKPVNQFSSSQTKHSHSGSRSEQPKTQAGYYRLLSLKTDEYTWSISRNLCLNFALPESPFGTHDIQMGRSVGSTGMTTRGKARHAQILSREENLPRSHPRVARIQVRQKHGKSHCGLYRV